MSGRKHFPPGPSRGNPPASAGEDSECGELGARHGTCVRRSACGRGLTASPPEAAGGGHWPPPPPPPQWQWVSARSPHRRGKRAPRSRWLPPPSDLLATGCAPPSQPALHPSCATPTPIPSCDFAAEVFAYGPSEGMGGWGGDPGNSRGWGGPGCSPPGTPPG